MKKEYVVELEESEADELMDSHWVGELIFCKECRYGEWSQNMRKEDMILCNNRDTGIEDGFLHELDWFCAEGEKRQDDG